MQEAPMRLGEESNGIERHPGSGLRLPDLLSLDSRANLGREFSVIRRAAFEKLLERPFPTAASELWRQTKPEYFNFADLRAVGEARLELLDFSRHDPCPIASGVRFSPGFVGEGELLEEVLGLEGGANADEAVSLLQLSAASCGGVLRLSENCNLASPIMLAQGRPRGQAVAPLVIVVVEQGAKFTLVEDLSIAEQCFYFPRIEVVIRDNAQCSFVSMQRSGIGCQYLARHRFHLGRDANLHSLHVVLGAQISRVDLECRLYGTGGHAQLDSLFLADERRHVDFHPVQDHLAPYCSSNLYCKGALRGNARSVYYGLIRVREKAQKTDAYQKNRNLVLSADARADAVPNLEIRANDVRCSHGATIGQVSQDELFYLMTRGLSEQMAERILVEGFFEDLLSRQPEEPVYDFVRRHVLERLNATS